MTAEVKLRTLAMQDAILQNWFVGTNGIIRWFDRQLQPGYIRQGACVRIMRVSTVFAQTHETTNCRSLNALQQPRFQIDVLDLDAERARSAAASIIDWLSRIDLSSDAQFGSPITSPTRHAFTLLNQRAGMEPQTQPPAYVESLDLRLFDLQDD